MPIDSDNLTPGQMAILDQLRILGGPITADRFAWLCYGRDIEELGAEELESIPAYLLEPWLEEQEREGESR